MKLRVILALALCLGAGGDAIAQLASPFSQSVWPAQTFTATGQTGTVMQLNGLVSSTSTVGSSFASGSLTVTGTSLTTVTFAVMGSSDNGATYYPLPIYTAASPTATPSASITATASGIYQISLAGLTHVKIVTSGTFTATTVSIVFTASPNASISKGSSGGGSGSQQVIYTSKLAGATGGVTVLPGSSASGTTSSAAAINAALSGGNVDLEVDSGYALSTSLVLYSNTTIHCIAPQYGFIMQPSANAPILANAHPEAPTTASGTGGFLVSNIVDQNIRLSGCQFNENSTQAVTGNGAGSVPHMTNPATGLFVPGTFFIGTQNVTVDHNEIYDPGVFSVFFTNSQNIHVSDNYIHVPQPPVLNKGTDGVHFIGPDKFLWVTNNRINAGDDSVAFNADDGNRPGSGDPNFTYTSSGVWLPVQWGPITDFHEDSNTLDACLYGGRLLSATELIDRGTITNLSGACTDYIENISAPYTSLGPGNMGNITMDNINVPVGPQSAGWGAAIPLNSTIQSLQIRGLHYTNPGSTNPIINHTAGTVGILSLRDWDVNTQSSSFTTGVALAGGTVTQFALSGTNWNDAGSGHLVGGSVVPAFITCSNYAGPNRLLTSGFAPSIENGDCFTNTYGSSIPTAIHFWPMNEGTGATLHDSIGTTNLTATNVTWSTSSGMGTSAVAQFNGTSSNASAAAVDSTLNFNGSQPMTVCYWANYASSSSASETVIGNLQTASSFQGWEVGNSPAGLPPAMLIVGAVSSNQLTMNSATNITAGAALYCWTYSGSLTSAGVKLYLDGSIQSISASVNTLTSGSTSTSPVFVGSRNNASSFFQGALAYVRVWNQVLTSGQITTLFSNGPQ